MKQNGNKNYNFDADCSTAAFKNKMNMHNESIQYYLIRVIKLNNTIGF